MAKHRMPKQRRGRKTLLAAATAAGISSTLVLAHSSDTTTTSADVKLAATVIGVGGRDDPNAARVQTKLTGGYAFGFVADKPYVAIVYPANLLFQSSIDVGIPELAEKIEATDGTIRVVSYSEGTLVAEQVKRDLADDLDANVPGTPTPEDLDFVFMASPYSPNGGIFARFPGLSVPGLLPVFSAAEPTPYDSIYVTHEYDGFADFPAYFNVLSIANAVLGMAYAHPDKYYDGINLATDDYVKTVVDDNGAGGTDTYYFVYNEHLPLLAPIRQVAALLPQGVGTALTEPVLSAIEPLLKVAVDAGYTDRENAHPETPTPFSFITPPAKIVEALNKVPGAIAEGVENATGGGQSQTQQTQQTQDARIAAVSEEPVDNTAEKDKAAEPDKAVEKKDRRITHPTLTSLGNKFAPKSVAAGTPGTEKASSSLDGEEGSGTEAPTAPASAPVSGDPAPSEPKDEKPKDDSGAAA